MDDQESCMKNRLGNLWASFLDTRTQREKNLLAWGGATIAAALIYLLLWQPAYEGRASVQARLPILQGQLAQMRTQAQEAQNLEGNDQAVRLTGETLKTAIEKSLSANDLIVAQIELIGPAVQMQLKNVSFSLWVKWLDEARQQFRIQLTEAHIEALSTDGQVDVQATLQAASFTK
jgi:general secretion pathway protein M